MIAGGSGCCAIIIRPLPTCGPCTMIYTTLKIRGSLEAKRAAFCRVLTESVKTVVRNWHKRVLPDHFKPVARRRYNYAARSRRYQIRKNRRGLGPLVYSGRSMRQLTRAIRPTGSRGNIKGKFVTDGAIRYFWMRPAGHPNKAAELIATSKQERDRMGRAIEDLTAKGLDAVNDKKVVR